MNQHNPDGGLEPFKTDNARQTSEEQMNKHDSGSLFFF